MGRVVEHFHRHVPFDSILGGCKFMLCILAFGRSKMILLCVAAEDVLGDLGVRQAIRGIPKNARL
jgi:hypothetical protein